MLITPRGKAEVYLRLPGNHSISNALAAAAVALEFEFDARAIASALHGFAPPARRMNIVNGRNGATVREYCPAARPVEFCRSMGELSWREPVPNCSGHECSVRHFRFLRGNATEREGDDDLFLEPRFAATTRPQLAGLRHVHGH